MNASARSKKRWPIGLALASWLPLLAGLYFAIEPFDTARILHLTVAYGAAMLCFLGGVRFGAALMAGTNAPWTVRAAPLVALIGLLALMLPAQVALAVLVVGFGAQGALDVWAGFQGRLPQNYVTARSLMTWLFALTLLGILLVTGRS